MKRRPYLLAIVVVFCALAWPPSFAQQSEGASQDFDSLRTLAEQQAGDPAVADYAEESVPPLDTLVNLTMIRCIRRELYSRRSALEIVLTVQADGFVSSAVVKTENRITNCAARTFAGMQLPPPPKDPLYILIGAHFGQN